MVQTERETGALRGQFARQAAVQASAAAQAESARAQAEQLSRKLAAARAEVRRYQTRMFAFERTLLALKHDNAELEAACEQAWEQLEQANARAEKAEAACRRARGCSCRHAADRPGNTCAAGYSPRGCAAVRGCTGTACTGNGRKPLRPGTGTAPGACTACMAAGDPAGTDGCGADGLVRCHDAPRMNLKRTAACFAQQSFFFLRGTI